ncbi:hypothetical protein [Sinomonas mesophila]|nr:hypothetical protein [Sinomonas mesophila]
MAAEKLHNSGLDRATPPLEGRHEHVLVPPSLTVRSSTAPPPAVVR